MNEKPSFVLELLSTVWTLLKYVVPVCIWFAFVVWVFYPNPIAISLTLNGSVLLFVLIFIARMNYTQKKKDWEREQENRRRDEQRAAQKERIR